MCSLVDKYQISYQHAASIFKFEDSRMRMLLGYIIINFIMI
jgi:hypothetical protein